MSSAPDPDKPYGDFTGKKAVLRSVRETTEPYVPRSQQKTAKNLSIRFTASELATRTLEIWLPNAPIYMGIAVATNGPLYVLFRRFLDPLATINLPMAVSVAIFDVIANFVASMFLAGLVGYLAIQRLHGRPLRLAAGVARVREHTRSLLLAGLAVGAAAWLPFIAATLIFLILLLLFGLSWAIWLSIPVLIAAIVFFFAITSALLVTLPVITIERLGVKEAILRSLELTVGDRRKLYAGSVLLSMFLSSVAFVAKLGMTQLGWERAIAYVDPVVQLASYSLVACFVGSAYCGLRLAKDRRKEAAS